MKKRFLLVTAMFILCVVTLQAQDEIEVLKNQIASTNTSMRSTYIMIRNLIYVICGIIGLSILPGKYQKMQSGDPDAGKSMLNWGGALVFVAVGAYVLQLIFFAG
ncbi:DUF4134 domain-containing protein [Rhodocytophaga rosea]|uniref:DUF4134 domain-containing protein n=2 Tax=Rhodocytophaga TaxID=455076 RepID=A0A6C0GCI7_9BACT|nr:MULTISPECIES: DUF4134 family protein [Rhodocytophaga]MDO1444666.1 DUF4134 family protein [Rhodocytophaga aerolata]QHT65390.1 DUF4134 domain-containing protein [Rhodocytophaga rosea]